MKRFFFFLACIFLLAGCGDQEGVTVKTFWMDNPTGEPVMVSIDGDKYILPPGGGQDIKLKAGAHEMVVSGPPSPGEKFGPVLGRTRFMVKPLEGRETFINPTFSTYILYHEVYQMEGSNDNEREYERVVKNYLREFSLGAGESIELPAKAVNSLFIEQGVLNWNYGLHEEFPDSAEFDDSARYSVLGKIFREDDFFEYFGPEEFPENFHFTPAPKSSWASLKPFALFPKGIASGCEEAEPCLANWQKQFQAIPGLTSPDKVADACTEVFQTIPYGQDAAKLEQACNYTVNRSLPKNTYAALLQETRQRAMDALFCNVYILEE